MQVRIHPASPNDAPAAVGLMAQLAEFSHGQVDTGVEDRFRAMIKLPTYAIFVAKNDNGHVVGLLTISQRWTLWHTGPCALIEELVVDEGVRGQGVGRALIQAAIDWAKTQRCSEVEVSTEADNLKAQAFYRRLGFESVALLLEYELD
ncbi:MAG: GNAT family N-acetyltransferase [Anaerolineae bacterium]|jgi:ribosomal protein S18 acetylase RimI-like enzyme